MKAEINSNRDSNRQKLADIIPLPAPFTVYIEQTRGCNLKCFYCIHSTRDEVGGDFSRLGYQLKHMDFKEYLKIVDDLSEFPPGSVKRVVFSGLGEPLANPRLPELIKIMVDQNIADRVDVITNGLFLNEKLSRKLIEAGLANINISIQGLSGERYKEVCGVGIDFERFRKQLEYLYSIRGDTKIYIKIIDVALNGEGEKKHFYDLFGDFADRIFIEHVIQMQQSHEKIRSDVDCGLNLYGEKMDENRKVCSPSFYHLQVGCDLDIFPCPIPGLPKTFALGNARENSLKEIWNGKSRFSHLRKMLRFEKNTIPVCSECVCYNVIGGTAECLDGVAPEILAKLIKQRVGKV